MSAAGQLDLLSWAPKKPRRIGATFSETRDGKRLERQYERVMRVLSDGLVRTLRQLADDSNSPEASASARFREIKQNGHPVHSRYDDRRQCWLYWMERREG